MAAVTFMLQSCIIFLSWDFILVPVNLQLAIQLTKADQKFNVRLKKEKKPRYIEFKFVYA